MKRDRTGAPEFAAFMAATRGFPAHKVTKVLGRFTPGINWSKCSKGHLADRCASAHEEGPLASHYGSLKRLDLVALTAALNK